MPKRIEIRGVIVPSSLDSSWLKDLIDKGVVTPESRVREGLKGAGDAELYINSPGGSVFAGSEMANAINDHIAAGNAVTIVVGAMAASAAANLLATVKRAKAVAHANTKIMFHGAAGYTEGGEEAHADTAELLASINGEIKTSLVAHGIESATVDEWFAEGRQGWLTADQALGYGLIDEIIADRATAMKFDASDLAQFSEAGIAIAACALEADEPPPANEPEQSAPVDPPAPPASYDDWVAAEILAAKADFAAQLDTLRSEHKTAIDSRDSLIAKRQSELDKLKSENERLNTAVAETTAKLDKFLSGGLTFHGSPEVATWEDALAACDGDYVAARRKYPTQYQSFMESRKRK